jgi:transketolase
LRRGACVLAGAPECKSELILTADASEVSPALGTQRELQAEGIQARAVSRPSWQVFWDQPQAYRDPVPQPSVRAHLAVETAAPLDWHKHVGDEGEGTGIERFGVSVRGGFVLREYGFSVNKVVGHALAWSCAGNEAGLGRIPPDVREESER